MLENQTRFGDGVQRGTEKADPGELVEHKAVLDRIIAPEPQAALRRLFVFFGPARVQGAVGRKANVTTRMPLRKTSHAAALCACFTAAAVAADPALTIYNQDFAVIRETVPLDLSAGSNSVRFSGATAHLEPDSVILRDPAGKRALVNLEQNYRADPISQELLLNLYEGKTIDFMIGVQDGSPHVVAGKIVRSGYVPHYEAMQRYGSQYQNNQMAMVGGGSGQPIIEVNGKLQFSLPGQPIFPALGDDTILTPALDWIIRSDAPAKFDAELSYVTGGMTWSADYNVVAPETGDLLDLVGWVTLDNQSGKQFDHARIKLVAGDVNKMQPAGFGRSYGAHLGTGGALAPPAVTERSFEDYHLYSLPLPTTLRDRETKQVEFLRASGISSQRLYVYDGSLVDRNQLGQDLRRMPQYGTESNPHVWVIREFANSKANQLGMPLPKGRVRFYRRDQDGQLEFTGENEIDHTATGETIRVYTGDAFDITGERKQTQFQIQDSYASGSVDESFEIKLRNHKKEPATVRVVEHLYRWHNWAITRESDSHRQADSRNIEYEVTLQPDQEKVVAYTVHYTW
jgi:hypothetical protein